VVPCFRGLFFVDMSSSATPGNSSAAPTQFLRRPRWPSTKVHSLGISHNPHPPIPMGTSISGLLYRSLSLQPADSLASLSELTKGFPPANGDFYFRASSGLIARTAAGYNYGGN
jgi:hypothetical protein